MADSPYERVMVNAYQTYACTFCGCIVAAEYWDDHTNWHETLDMQATAVMRRSLRDMEDSLGTDLRDGQPELSGLGEDRE